MTVSTIKLKATLTSDTSSTVKTFENMKYVENQVSNVLINRGGNLFICCDALSTSKDENGNLKIDDTGAKFISLDANTLNEEIALQKTSVRKGVLLHVTLLATALIFLAGLLTLGLTVGPLPFFLTIAVMALIPILAIQEGLHAELHGNDRDKLKRLQQALQLSEKSTPKLDTMTENPIQDIT